MEPGRNDLEDDALIVASLLSIPGVDMEA